MKSDVVLTLNIGDETRHLDQELAINHSNPTLLSMELASQPSWYAYYAALGVEATALYDLSKSAYEQVYAQVTSQIRSAAQDSSKKITEKQIELEATIHPEVVSAKNKLLEDKKKVALLKVAITSFEQRLQTLMSICAFERVQLQNDPSFKGNSDNNMKGGGRHNNNVQKQEEEESTTIQNQEQFTTAQDFLKTLK